MEALSGARAGPFCVVARDASCGARAGVLHTAHGVVETPVFMPVGTQGTVKAMAPWELEELGTQVVLGNTYHLHLRPGEQRIARLGGLHRFMAWPRTILTDSGGYQVFSLAKLRKISSEGVHFQSHLDGTPVFLSPERSMEIQCALGADIVMALDECPPWPCTYEAAARSLEVTLAWERRSLAWWEGRPARPLVFGIVQGSSYADLRARSAQALVELGFDGYAIGGVSVGEPQDIMLAAVEYSVPHLPESAPRYAMGLGTPPQILEMVARGVDMFDCVLPTRLARNGTAFTSAGPVALENACHAEEERPIEEGCACHACRRFSRAYIRHLLKAREILGLRLITLHNLHFYLSLMREARHAILNGTFARFRAARLAAYTSPLAQER